MLPPTCLWRTVLTDCDEAKCSRDTRPKKKAGKDQCFTFHNRIFSLTHVPKTVYFQQQISVLFEKPISQKQVNDSLLFAWATIFFKRMRLRIICLVIKKKDQVDVDFLPMNMFSIRITDKFSCKKKRKKKRFLPWTPSWEHFCQHMMTTALTSRDHENVSPAHFTKDLDEFRHQGFVRGGQGADPHAVDVGVDRLLSDLWRRLR